ncbi:MAG: glycoside hydrolase family 32 protein [Chitinophagia bacterium]|nr:glycoside hydrolase family 32 protein [Chitinophagia bacterium]
MIKTRSAQTWKLVLYNIIFSCAIACSFLPVCLFAQEPYRPFIHFSPKAHWMNDPNGLVFYKGNYHLFYQYYPGAKVWGPMHWGHAISKDLINWQHLPIALYPDSLGYIFSGSVVVDEFNTANLQQGKEKTLIAIFTYHDPQGEKAGSATFQTQGMAYSNDGGFTWKKYANNPVLSNPGKKDFRDPKVSWYAKEKKWVMTLAVGNHVELYSSPNLKVWTYLSSFGEKEGAHGGVWECPDLIRMPDASTGKEQWVLLVSIGNGGPNGGSATQYFTGAFNGKEFINDEQPQMVKWVDQGTDNYAGVTYFNAPGKDPIFIGWMSNWQYAQQVPTDPWRSAITIPRTLQIKTMDGHKRLLSNPFASLLSYPLPKINASIGATIPLKDEAYEIKMEVSLPAKPEKDTLLLANWTNAGGDTMTLQYEVSEASIIIDRTHAGIVDFHSAFAQKIVGKRIQKTREFVVQLIMDRSSLELFTDDGSLVMSVLFFPRKNFDAVQFPKFH